MKMLPEYLTMGHFPLNLITHFFLLLNKNAKRLPFPMNFHFYNVLERYLGILRFKLANHDSVGTGKENTNFYDPFTIAPAPEEGINLIKPRPPSRHPENFVFPFILFT